MWYKLRSRCVLAIFAPLLVTSCSLRPLYDEGYLRRQSTGAGISVGVIADRDGQRLRSYLVDLLRDLPITDGKYLLDVCLSYREKAFAFGQDGYAKRQFFTYIADVGLMDCNRKTLMRRQIKVHSSHNISRGQWGIEVSLYGRHSSIVMKQLAYRIIEAVRVFLLSKSP